MLGRMKKIIITAISAFAVFAAAAQNQISQQIEVTREYRPDIERADKLEITPRAVDTVALRPDVQYRITPTPWKTKFDARPIKPIGISAAEYVPAWPYYIRLGGGLPGMTLVDLYATSRNPKGNYAGAYFNHYGEHARLRNDMDEKLKARWERNIIGGFAAMNFGRRNLTADIVMDNRLVSPFGAFSMEGNALDSYRPDDPGELKYMDITATIAYGDLFKDFSRFNWKLGLTGGYFTDHSKHNQAYVSFNAGIGTGIGGGELILDLDVTNKSGLDDLKGLPGGLYSNTLVTATPRYGFMTKDVNLVLGASLIHDKFGDSKGRFRVLPVIEAGYDIPGLFTVYGKADGEVIDGSFRALSYRNPYMSGGGFLPNSSRIGARIGLFGAVFPHISYDIYFGCDTYNDYHYFANFYGEGNTTQFVALGDIDPSIYYMGMVLKANIARGLTFDLKAQYNNVGGIDYEGDIGGTPAIAVPAYEVDAILRYDHNEKVFVSLGCEFVGKREASTLKAGAMLSDGGSFITEELPAYVNLKAEVEFRLIRHANFFVAADNILNKKIYRFNHYPQLGANVMAGFKLRF